MESYWTIHGITNMNVPDQSPRSEETSITTARRRGYPLGMLFVLTAACAILVAFVGPATRAVSRDELPIVDAIVAIGIGSVLGMALGLLVGMFHEPVGRSMLLGLLTGFFVGATIGSVIITPYEYSAELAAIALGGTLLLPVMALIIRWLSRK